MNDVLYRKTEPDVHLTVMTGAKAGIFTASIDIKGFEQVKIDSFSICSYSHQQT